MMKNNKKKILNVNNGITLIALVITIIVLLILAGVAISMLSGENGILNQATSAKERTEKKSVEEEIQLAAAAAITNKNHKIENREELEEELYKYGLKLDEVEENKDEKAESWLITQQGITYTITDNGTVRPYILPEDYGAIVTNYEVRDEIYKDEEIEWKIFLDDGKNIYLIASDYLQRDNLPLKNNHRLNDGLSQYPKAAYFNNILNDYNGSSDIIKNDKISHDLERYHKWIKIHPESNNNNVKAVAYMLDTEVWNGYSNNKAYYAIGGPTVEMFCESYNKTHINKTIDYNVENDWGYSVKWSSDKNYTNLMRGLNKEENLFVIKSTINTLAMWLASPAANEITGLMCCDYLGQFGHYSGSYADRGFRPIICLKAETNLEKQKDGTYLIM